MKQDEIELRRGSGGRPQLRKAPRRARFTLAKQERFFAALTATCNVAAACRAARISTRCVYHHRIKSAAFRARWAVAIREAYVGLELMMLERAMNGTVKTITRPDGGVQTVHEYPNNVAMLLLKLHRDTASAAEQEHDPEDVDEVRARIAKKIDRLRQRIEREQAQGRGDAVFRIPEAGGLPRR
jgi:hypothetical protein